MSVIENVSPRHFLGTTLSTSAFVLAAQVLPKSAFAQDPAVRTRAQAAPLNPDNVSRAASAMLCRVL